MFLNIDKKKPDSMAILDSSGLRLTYGELCDFCHEFNLKISSRALIFILGRNCVGVAAAYIASLSSRIVPLLLNAGIEKGFLKGLIETYKPAYVWAPADIDGDFGKDVWGRYDCTLYETNLNSSPMNNDLSLLLPTSGSTGSPKLVRHSYKNVEANAENVARFFDIEENERPMLDSPIYNTYGLSILSSHIFAGATVLLTPETVLSRAYWNLFNDNNATSISGVPYTFELLKKLRFFNMDLPSLTTITQGGGRLSDNLYLELAEYARATNRRFIPTYGQSESTARMSGYIADDVASKCCTIGKPIPNGKMTLINESGVLISQPGEIGEIVFEGLNVTLGYAENASDLIRGDERGGVLFTGDLAITDSDGCFYIVGRKSRFLKLYGTRVGLDECERMISSTFNTECACTGDDTVLKVYLIDAVRKDEVASFVPSALGINPVAVEVIVIASFPRNEAGKILYNSL